MLDTLTSLLSSIDLDRFTLLHNSKKPRIDTRIRFSIEPLVGDECFQQWRDAMKAVARLPQGIPSEFRKKVWLALADHSLRKIKLDWEKTKRFAFNERSNPDDNKLGIQIVKDLHRTGCSGFSGQDNEEERAILKRVLLGYARWNKRIGYCQGFNVLAALILDVFQRKEDDALKVMIFLIDHVLPESYFANNLRALSVDMAVFRDLLRLTYPQLSDHLDHLQSAARDHSTGANYEPPLTNVFTMQWFLTVFATCLPKESALRVWDAVMLEGSEMMLRTATAIWGKLQDRILQVQSADEFYTIMGTLSREMLDSQLVGVDSLMKSVYTNQELNFPQLSELREKYTYNITPFSAAMATGQRPTKKGAMNIFSDEDEFDEEEYMEQNIGCFTSILPYQSSPYKNHKLSEIDKVHSASAYDISKATPGAYAAHPEALGDQWAIANMERMTTDIGMLQKQYGKLRSRQKQAHIIMEAAAIAHHQTKQKNMPAVAPIKTPAAVNHLFIGHHGKYRRNKCVVMAPCIAPMFNGQPTNSTKLENKPQKLKSPQISKQSNSEEIQSEPSIHSDANDRIHHDNNNNNKIVRTVSGSSLYSDTETASLHAAEENESPSSPNIVTNGIHLINDPTNIISEEDSSEPSCTPSISEDRLKQNVSCNNESFSGIDVSVQSNVDQRKPVKDSFTPNNDPSDIDSSSTPTLLQLSKSADDCDLNEKIQLNNFISIQKVPSKFNSQEQINSSKLKSNQNSFESPLCKLSMNNKSSSMSILDSDIHDKNKKGFNPFPSQHINKSRTKNGIRLGLYAAPESNPTVRSPKRSSTASDIDTITRSHINKCLTRQYIPNLNSQRSLVKR